MGEKQMIIAGIVVLCILSGIFGITGWINSFGSLPLIIAVCSFFPLAGIAWGILGWSEGHRHKFPWIIYRKRIK
jgi:hypothetical protein